MKKRPSSFERKQKEPDPTARQCALRMDQLFEHWCYWLRNLHGQLKDQHVPTLDGRSCIVIDEARRDCVMFCVATMSVQNGRIMDEDGGNYSFTPVEARRVFDQFYRLRANFARRKHPTADRAEHLAPETWTKRPVHDWHRSSDTDDIALFIASLVAYWDACMVKPPYPHPSTGRKRSVRKDWDRELYDFKALPKFVRLEGLPPGLARQLRKHAVKREWAKR